MNSKTLLEYANARIEKMCSLTGRIEVIEKFIRMSEENAEIALYHSEEGIIRLSMILPKTVTTNLKESAINEIINALNKNTAELRELLGTEPDQAEIVKKNCITGETIIESDKSLDKYPAKKQQRKSPYPENMTEEKVREMYIDQGMQLKQVAEYFNVKPTQINSFLQKHGLFRRSYKKTDKKKPDKEIP